MKKNLLKGGLIILALLLSANCFAEEYLYEYDYTYDVNTQQISDIFGSKKKVVVVFSADKSMVYVKGPKEKELKSPYYYKGGRGNYFVYQRTDYRSDGVPYFPTIAFSRDYKTMSDDFGDHTAFNTLDVYNLVSK